MKVRIRQQWRRLLAACLTLVMGTTVARVTIDEAGKERMAQQLMGQVSGLREMQGSLALAQEGIEMLQRKLRVLKMQADQLGSSQLDALIRGAQIELDSKVARTAAIADKAGVGQMQPYYRYAMDALEKAKPLMDGYADRVGEFSPDQLAEAEVGRRSAEAAVASDKRTFFANMMAAHRHMAGVVSKAIGTSEVIGSYFDGYFTYAKGKDFVTDGQRDELWGLLSWFMLDYLSEEGPAGERSIFATMRRVRRDHSESYDELMKHIPAAYHPTKDELGRPHSDWLTVVEEQTEEEGTVKYAFVLLQVAMWQATLFLGNKAVAAQKDMELDGVLKETRDKLKEMGVAAERVDKARTALEVSELAMERASNPEGDEDTSDLASLATRIHEVADEFQRATSHATSAERELKEAAARGESPAVRRSVAPAASSGSSAMRYKHTEDDGFDKDDEEESSGSFGWVKLAVIGAGVLFAAAKLYSKYAKKTWKTEQKWQLKKKIDTVIAPLGGAVKDGAKFVVGSIPVVGRLPWVERWATGTTKSPTV